MQKYEHGGDIYANSGVELDFSVNTNPLGLSAEIRKALVSRVAEFGRYPDPECRELRAAIALHDDVPQSWVLCGNGAADLIYRLCYALKPRRALVCAPAFSEYERALGQAGCAIERHIMSEESGFALSGEILAQLVPGIEMLFLCHPNNPTGRLISSDLVSCVLHRAQQIGAIVVVDECFLAFTNGQSSKRLLSEMPGLVVLQAFTKLYAMAGLRLGYLLCADLELLGKISEAAQCWSVSVPAQIAGVAALGLTDWPRQTRTLIASERQFLSESLRGQGLTVFPSDANFLLIRSQTPLYTPLLKKGILIRRCENFIGLNENYYRVAVKTRGENARLVEAVKEVING